MKRILTFLLVIGFISLSVCSCKSVTYTNSSRNSSPGQIKKETGSQSARPYAPGQVKKETGSQSAKPYAPGQQKKKEHGHQKKNKSKKE